MTCLLCASPVIAPGKNPLLGPFRARSESSAHDDDGSRDAQLWGTFVLTQMFDLSNEECRKLLETGGVAGDRWITKICGTCVHDAQQFRQLEEQRLEIERKMGSMIKAAHGKLLDLCLEDHRNDGRGSGQSSSSSVQRQIRMYFQGVFRTLGSVPGSTSQSNHVQDQPNVGEQAEYLDKHVWYMGGGIYMVPSAPGGGETSAPLSTLEQDAEQVAISFEVKRSQRNNVPPSEPIGDYHDHTTTTEFVIEDMVGDETMTTTTLSNSNVRPLDSTTGNRDGPEGGTEDVDVSYEVGNGVSGNDDDRQGSLNSMAKKQGFSCTSCGKSFRQKAGLTQHLIVHTGQKFFVCFVCNKGFSFKGNLKQHMRVHTKDKPYKCQRCNKSFTTRYTLNQHAKIKKPCC